MESVYLVTTFFSYLVARPSRDVIVAAHRQMTLDWRETRRGVFAGPISQVVMDEASQGDPAEIRKRWEILETLPVLEVTETAATGQSHEMAIDDAQQNTHGEPTALIVAAFLSDESVRARADRRIHRGSEIH